MISMMSDYDGGNYPIKKQSRIILVFFGDSDPEIQSALLGSLDRFFTLIHEELPVIPVILSRYEPMPGNIPLHNQYRVFFSVLQKIDGNIVIGITDTAFADSEQSCQIFCYGQIDGRGMLSLYRFRKEAHNRKVLLEQVRKYILKVLALACTVDTCPDTGCIVSYHRRTEDVDRNRYVCEACRYDFVRNLAFFLSVPEGNQGTLLLPECE
jgi:predicted Zn-dependent protease